MFKHELLPTVDGIQQVNFIDGKPVPRFYLYKGKRYTSCTTFIGQMLDEIDDNNTSLENWKKKVGEKTANEIRDRAAAKGTLLHEVCEDYILGKEDYLKGKLPTTKASFRPLKPILDSYINEVYGVEYQCISKKYKTAGTIDLVCKWNGVNAIVDFKTSRSIKKKKNILRYYLQATMYGEMIEEQFSIEIPKAIILITVENEKRIQKVEFDRKEFSRVLENLYQKYLKKTSN